MCLDDISKDFTIRNMKKKIFFSVDFNPIDTNVLDIHRYLMKGKYYKIMFELIK